MRIDIIRLTDAAFVQRHARIGVREDEQSSQRIGSKLDLFTWDLRDTQQQGAHWLQRKT